MPATVLSAATLGIDAYPVHVEVDTDRQLPSFTVVGLPDNAVKESRERVMAAVRNSGYEWPRRRVTVTWHRHTSAKKARRLTCPSPSVPW